MAFYKVIASGSVIEVYEYEKEPVAPCMFDIEHDKHNQYEKIVLGNDEKNWIHEKVNRTEERRKQTLREARNTTRRLALMNFGEGDTFITLTYPNERHLTENEIDIADDDFKKFMKRFRYKYGDIKYIAVREFTKRGRIHFHMICNWKQHFEDEEHLKEFERYFGQKLWKHGFVDIKVMDGVDNIGAYLIKYMTKNIAIEAFKGHKTYLCSKGLDRPLEFKGEEAENVLAAYGLLNKKEVFTNSYISEYLGTITYKEFNLKRL